MFFFNIPFQKFSLSLIIFEIGSIWPAPEGGCAQLQTSFGFQLLSPFCLVTHISQRNSDTSDTFSTCSPWNFKGTFRLFTSPYHRNTSPQEKKRNRRTAGETISLSYYNLPTSSGTWTQSSTVWAHASDTAQTAPWRGPNMYFLSNSSWCLVCQALFLKYISRSNYFNTPSLYQKTACWYR